jgi:hypothetical protein
LAGIGEPGPDDSDHATRMSRAKPCAAEAGRGRRRKVGQRARAGGAFRLRRGDSPTPRWSGAAMPLSKLHGSG